MHLGWQRWRHLVITLTLPSKQMAQFYPLFIDFSLAVHSPKPSELFDPSTPSTSALNSLAALSLRHLQMQTISIQIKKTPPATPKMIEQMEVDVEVVEELVVVGQREQLSYSSQRLQLQQAQLLRKQLLQQEVHRVFPAQLLGLMQVAQEVMQAFRTQIGNSVKRMEAQII